MKNYKKLLLILLFLPYTVQSQNNVRLAPNSDTVCYNTSLYLVSVRQNGEIDLIKAIMNYLAAILNRQ